MPTLPYLTLDKDVRQLSLTDVERFAARIGGRVLSAIDDGYHDARQVWNGAIDRRPALIARCLHVGDVRAAVQFAGERRMLVSVRGGGHHIAGNAVAEGGLMIDLSGMRTTKVDVNARTVQVAAGALLGDLDRATQAHGLATPLGINSTTGVGGLTLGGGFGWLSRRFGMTIDNLLAATVVTADGQVRTASEHAEPELFWALRGGGGNFGVATSFDFRLHPVGPEIYAGFVVYPYDQAQQVLRAWRGFTESAPDELSVWAVLRRAPPLPFLNPAIHGTNVLILAVAYCGGTEAGTRVTAPILDFGRPIGQALMRMPYAAFQTALDPLLTPGRRNYWKSCNFTKLPDAALDVFIDAAGDLPGSESELFVAHLGGAMSRVDPAATAYSARDASYIMNVHGRWTDARDDDRMRTWARTTFRKAGAYATGSGYVNFLTDDEPDRVAAAYGANYARLQAAKGRFDPENLFRMNLNITPAGGIRERHDILGALVHPCRGVLL